MDGRTLVHYEQTVRYCEQPAAGGATCAGHTELARSLRTSAGRAMADSYLWIGPDSEESM